MHLHMMQAGAVVGATCRCCPLTSCEADFKLQLQAAFSQAKEEAVGTLGKS